LQGLLRIELEKIDILPQYEVRELLIIREMGVHCGEVCLLR